MDQNISCPECGKPMIAGKGCPDCLFLLGLPGASDSPPDAETSDLEPSSRDEHAIGLYRLLQKLGEGGMGEVWEAEQTEPVRRRVALKVIKRGMDTRQVVARFEAERQALALMDHPNVAKVFDAGATPRGRPYFVMELVRGVPITQHCDRHRLTMRQRLELLRDVCDGVQHAHHKAIIHRDLKPSNVLVSIRDGKAEPKIIDFGVAKATAQRLTERSLYTEQGILIGTPEYMSPEQAEMTGQDVDTRTDVYSLGVMLYELLVGALPFEPKQLRAAGFAEIVRRIREEEPPKPSVRVSTLGDRTDETASSRGLDPQNLRRELRGDLDWITMKALEKDRRRRYGSPQELAADIERHLDHQPVMAGPPSAIYRTRKFVRRHRLGVGVAAAAVLLLFSFAVRERVQSKRIAHERDKVKVEAETARQVSEFLTGLFELSNPSESRGISITAREILDKGAKKIDESLSGQPEVQARLTATMGEVYEGLGLVEQSARLLTRALEVRRDSLGDEHPSTVESMSRLAGLLEDLGQFDRARQMQNEAYEIRRRTLGDEHADTLRSRARLADLHVHVGEFDRAEQIRRDVMEAMTRVLGEEHADTLGAVHDLGFLYWNMDRLAVAEPLLKRALAGQRKVLGADHPATLRTMSNLSILYGRQRRYNLVEPLIEETLAAQKQVLGPDHPQTLVTQGNLAFLYMEQGRLDEAEPLLLENVERRARALGDEHAETLHSLGNLFSLYRRQKRFDEAARLGRDVVEARKRTLGVETPPTVNGISELAQVFLDQERYGDAEPLIREALAIKMRVLGDAHAETAQSAHALAKLLRDTNRHDEARESFEDARRMLENSLGAHHPFYAINLDEYALLLRKLGQSSEADRMEAESREIRERYQAAQSG